LPGGALLTTRTGGTGNVWSYPNTHGDVVSTADQAGAKQGATRVYDPYGNTLAGGDVPDNSAGNFDYGWLGQHQRPLEHEPALQPVIEMGARQYSPLLGRVAPELRTGFNLDAKALGVGTRSLADQQTERRFQRSGAMRLRGKLMGCLDVATIRRV
jgi:hypothetical protein